MRKTLVVAQSEFATLVRSKAFIISVVMMPIVMIGSTFVIRATKDSTDQRDRAFAYVDYGGTIGPVLEAAAAERDASMALQAKQPGARFQPVRVQPDGRTPEQLRLELSDRVRRKELFAFLELPADLLDPASTSRVLYYSDHPSSEALPQWLRTVVNRAVLNERFRTAGVDRALIDRLTKQTPLDQLGLFSRDANDRVIQAEKVDQIRAFALPGIILGLMYMTVMASAPQLLNSVVEEKMSRISEVLIASVTPFQLMMGKLIGSVGVSVVLASIYVAGGLVVARYYGYSSAITPAMLGWLGLFLVLGVFIFGSLFIAIGAACTDLKDSQNMMMPVMLLVMFPMFTWAAVLRAPDGMMAILLSMLPTAAPFLMMLRIALQPGPPLWQILLSISIMALTTVVFVWAAGKIFRTGLLMQGKSATFGEMIRWVRAG